jgi:hypothetical protein
MAKVQRKSTYDVVAKVVILGDSAVGKTNISHYGLNLLQECFWYCAGKLKVTKVYSVGDRTSFKNITNWLTQIGDNN